MKQVDETAKYSYKALGKVNEEELRELYKFLIEKEGTSQAEIHRKLQREIDWWKSVGDDKWKSGQSKGQGKKVKMVIATADSSGDEGEQANGASAMAVDSSDDDDEDQSSMPGELPYGENPDHDEGQGDELGDWLLQKKEYLEWKKYPQGLLWLYGDCKSPVDPQSPDVSGASLSQLTRNCTAGCGKSLLW